MSVTNVALFLWLAEVADSAKVGVGVLLFVLVVVTVVTYLGHFSGEIEARTGCLIFMPVMIVTLGTLFCLTPSKNTMYLIGGSYVGDNVIDKVSTSEEYKKLMELFNLSLDKALVELKKEEKK